MLINFAVRLVNIDLQLCSQQYHPLSRVICNWGIWPDDLEFESIENVGNILALPEEWYLRTCWADTIRLIIHCCEQLLSKPE